MVRVSVKALQAQEDVTVVVGDCEEAIAVLLNWRSYDITLPRKKLKEISLSPSLTHPLSPPELTAPQTRLNNRN